MSALIIVSLIIRKYFLKYPSYNCLKCINVCNILLASYRFYPFITNFQSNYYSFSSPSDEYIWGAFYFITHMTLLVNPCLSSNIIMTSIIFLINISVQWINNEEFHYLSFLLILCMGFFLYRLELSLKLKRKVFILKKENTEWGIVYKLL